MERGVRFALLALLLALGSFARAGTFGLSPMRVELSPSAMTAVVNVNNSGDEPLTIQIQAHTWSQVDGKDIYGETRDVIASPPIFTMPPGGRQVVRIALRGATPTTVEQPYRLVFREIPLTKEDTAAPGGGGLAFRIAVGMDIPMYVAPAAGNAAAKPRFTLETAADGTPRVRIGNDGTAHLRLGDVQVKQGSESLATREVVVVLPGSYAYVDLARGKLVPGRPVDLRAKGSAGTLELSLDAAKP